MLAVFFMTELRRAEARAIPVIDTMPADLLTPLAVYLKLAKPGSTSFLLESVEGGANLARYSFIGAGPTMTIRGDDKRVEIIQDDRSESRAIGIYDFLIEYFEDKTVATIEELPFFAGGAIGNMGFDCAEWFEPSLKRNSRRHGSSAEFMIFDSVVAFDHVRQLIQIVSLAFAEIDTAIAYEVAKKRNSEIRKTLECGELNLPAPKSNVEGSAATSNWKQQDFESAVSHIKELINAGEAYQVVLSQRLERKTGASPVSIYRALRSINPSPYMFMLQIDGRSIVGASPEMLVRCRDRNLEYRPIAGTRPRSLDNTEDQRLAEEMRCDMKEVAEHMMLVDLGRNDLGRVATFGSVKVDRLMEVEKYSHVQHLVSQLSAELADGCDRFDALAACFPAGTVSGAPKVRAIEIIRDLEPTPRGVYAGAVGYFDYGGNMDTCIAIRTMVLENGIATIQAGAGIVADSVPEREYQETLDKARVMLRAIDMAEGSDK
jgi:anthranilate synthase component 1